MLAQFSAFKPLDAMMVDIRVLLEHDGSARECTKIWTTHGKDSYLRYQRVIFR